MPQTWPEILEEVNEVIKASHSAGESVWFRGQNEPWSLRSKLHRHILELEAAAGKKGQIPQEVRASLLLQEFQTMYQVFGQKCGYFLPPIEQGSWGRVFSMQHYGIPTTLLDFTESFAVALYMANWNRDPKNDAAIYILKPLKMNAKCHVGLNQVALNDDSPGIISRPLVELYHPTLYNSVPEKVIPPELSDRARLPCIAVTPTAINGRMRAQKSTFVLSGPSFDPIDEAFGDAIQRVILPVSTYTQSRDWLSLVGFEHVEYFPDVWGVSVDFEIRSEHVRGLAAQIARESAL